MKKARESFGLMKKYQYILLYSTLDWVAYILKVPYGTKPEDVERDYAGHYTVFDTLKEAREEGLSKINHDIMEFKRMRDQIKGKVVVWEKDNDE